MDYETLFKALDMPKTIVGLLLDADRSRKLTINKNRIARLVALIDTLINKQLNVIIHHKKFQALESSWRGLQTLALASAKTKNVKIRVLNVNWSELSRDLSRAIEFDQSQLFNKVYSNEFDMPGGTPYGVILADFEIYLARQKESKYNDLNTLEELSHIAAAAFCPIICAAAPSLLGLDSFAELSSPIDYSEVVRQKEFIEWRQLRDQEDVRFIALTLPRFIIRKPYTNEITQLGNIRFKESTLHTSDYLWANGCYAIGTILIREFASVNWFSHIEGAPRDTIAGGIIDYFSSSDFLTDSPNVNNKILTEALVTDSREKELSQLGFISLCHCYDSDLMAIHSYSSIQNSKHFSNQHTRANARLSAMLQHILCASRFAHYIKVIIRDKIGSFINARVCENDLQKWLNKYSSGRDDLSWDLQARYPLREARVSVSETVANAGKFNCDIYLKPHYTASHLVAELKLSTELVKTNVIN